MMIRYSGQLKEYKFNYKRATVKGASVKKCLDIMSFDIEVTSAWMHEGKLIAYESGHDADFWNSREKYALPYIWQFSVNDDVYYGSEIKSFLKVLDDLPRDMYYLIFIHNASYEMMFLLNIIHIKECFARAPHKPMKFTPEEYPYIEFRCSYMLSNLSLDKWGKDLGVEKLTGELEYNYMRTPYHYDPETDTISGTPLFDYELEYAEQDCRVVTAGIRDLLKVYKNIWDLPLTSTGKVRRKVKKIVTPDKQYMRRIKRTVPESPREYKLLQTVFAGGYTHANRKYLGQVVKGEIHHRDVASWYPTALCAFKYPLNKWVYIGRQLPDPDTFEDDAYIIKLHMTGVKCISWNTYISGSKSRGRGILYDNGRILGADELYITVTEQDYLTILDTYQYESIESLGTYKNHKMYLPKVFIEIVLDFYGGKVSLKGRDPDQYALYKTYINALFGMCCTALIQENVTFNIDDPELWSIDPLSADKVEAALHKLGLWFNNKYFLSYNTGVYCTAYCRRYLWLGIMSIDEDLLYSDTDSFFYKGNHDFEWWDAMIAKKLYDMCEYYDIDFDRTHPIDSKGVERQLGALEVEDDDGAEMFKTLGAKKYILQYKGELLMTVAGINKGAVDCLEGDINKFSAGFIFDKDHPSVHKLEHTYLSNMKPVIYPGGYKSDLKYGINMRPTGYKLSMPNVYDDVNEILSEGELTFSEYFLAKHRGYFKL